MKARHFNASFVMSRDAAAKKYIPRLEAQYEQALRANARRAATAYRDKATVQMSAAGGPQANGRPTIPEIINQNALDASLRAKTLTSRRGIVQTIIDGLGLSAAAKKAHSLPVIRSVLSAQEDRTLRTAQQAVTDGVAAVIEQSFNDGLSVPHTADAIQEKLYGLARWQAVQMARTDLISLGNGASYAGADILGEQAPAYKTWVSAGDETVRPSHSDADGQSVPVDDTFDVGDEQLMYPGDPEGSDDETINCFPADTLVECPALRATMRRWYEGDVVRVSLASGDVLTATPNHPVLRADGLWTAIGEIEEGDYLVSATSLGKRTGAPDPDRPPVAISEVHRLADSASDPHRVRTSPPDLHGDGTDGEVEVVTVNGSLLVDVEAATEEEIAQFGFALTALARLRSCGGDVSPLVNGWAERRRGLAAGVISGDRERSSLPLIESLHPDGVGFASAADGQTKLTESPDDGGPTRSYRFGDGEDGFPGRVSLAEVVEVKRETMHGFVYNLDTGDGWYTANSVVARNCRCTLVYTDTEDATFAHSDFGGIVEGLTEPDDAALSAATHATIGDTMKSLTAADFSAKQRDKLANQGEAMPDGSYPIRNRSDLANAIQSLGRAKDEAAVKAHIIKRARALKATDALPKSWSITAGAFENGLLDLVGDVAELIADELTQAAQIASNLNAPEVAAYLLSRAATLCGAYPDADEAVEPGESDAMAASAMVAGASPLAEVLKPTLANVVSMYLSSHGSHWDVNGSDFAEYHALFGEIYDDVHDSIDPLAENILKLGGRAPIGLTEISSLATVPIVMDTGEPGSLAAQLNVVNDQVIESLQASFAVATSLDEQGVANFLADRIDSHQKWRWQLNASLGKSVDAAPDSGDILTASAAGLAPMQPPKAWFEVPEADEPTALTITSDGQVYGHAALWDVCHTGIPGRCTTAPRSPTGYQFFHLGAVETVEGATVPVGKITINTGHAPLTASRQQAASHYDHTGSVVAHVRAQDGKHGIWISGALRPDAPETKVHALRAASLSGDWRQVNGKLEMIGLLAVNVPGFPVPRTQSLAAGGELLDEQETLALVAAGVSISITVDDDGTVSTGQPSAPAEEPIVAAPVSQEDELVQAKLDALGRIAAGPPPMSRLRAAANGNLTAAVRLNIEVKNDPKARLSKTLLASAAGLEREIAYQITYFRDHGHWPATQMSGATLASGELNAAQQIGAFMIENPSSPDTAAVRAILNAKGLLLTQ